MTIRIRSNGSSALRLRRPVILVSRKMKKKATVARMTMSMASGVDGDRAVDVEQRRALVCELDVLRAVTDVCRVNLELDEGDDRVSSGDVAELEDDAAVVASFADRLRVDAVDLHALEPARVEDQG